MPSRDDNGPNGAVQLLVSNLDIPLFRYLSPLYRDSCRSLLFFELYPYLRRPSLKLCFLVCLFFLLFARL